MTALPIDAVLFDIGDTLVHAAPPGTVTEGLVAIPIGDPARDLAALRAAGLRIGAVTDTSVLREADVRALLRPLGIDELLEVVITSSDVGVEKPHPGGILRALDLLGVAPDRALFVGNAGADADAASFAGVAFARVEPGRTAADAARRHLSALVGPFAASAALVGPLDEAVRIDALAH